MKLESLKEGFGTLWENMADGWRHLTQSAAGALTRFRPGEGANLPASSEVDDAFYLPTRSWAMLGGDVFEDDRHLVVRLEVPGLEKEDIDIEIRDDTLVVTGEKHFERESARSLARGAVRLRQLPPCSGAAGRGRGRGGRGFLQERRAAGGSAQGGTGQTQIDHHQGGVTGRRRK